MVVQTDVRPSHLLTVLTPDKKGIIATICEIVEAARGRLIEVSQTVVGAYFTVIFVLQLDELDVLSEPGAADSRGPIDRLATRLRAALADGATLTLLPYRLRETDRPGESGQPYILTAHGPAGPGRLPLIARMIAERGGNFTDFSAREINAQTVLVAEVDLPVHLALEQLQIDLQHAAAEVGWQVRLQGKLLFSATNQIAFRRYETT